LLGNTKKPGKSPKKIDQGKKETHWQAEFQNAQAKNLDGGRRSKSSGLQGELKKKESGKPSWQTKQPQ